MRFDMRIEGDLREITRGEVAAGKKAVKQAMSLAGLDVRDSWRAQIRSQFNNGGRLANAIRAKTYPAGRDSFNAATFIYPRPSPPGKTGAPEIMAINETGGTVRSANGFWLAIPTPAAGGKTRGGRSITPAEWERKTGRQLQFVYLKGRSGILVDTGRVTGKNPLVSTKSEKTGFHRARTARARKLEKPVVMFVLKQQVRLRKRLNVMAMADQVARALPAMVAARWKDK